jgi:hypothetical protein
MFGDVLGANDAVLVDHGGVGDPRQAVAGLLRARVLLRDVAVGVGKQVNIEVVAIVRSYPAL